MDSRMAMIDLNIHLVQMEFGPQNELEELHELLCDEFPEDKITFDEVCEWNSLALEVNDLEQSFNICYEEYNY